jgi:Tol biopolymer transport system component
MTDERWQRVKALFQAALDTPVAEREAFLASAAGDDDALRSEVHSLLASDGNVGLLDRLPGAGGGVFAEAPGPPSGGEAQDRRLAPPHVAGPYEIGDLIGAGAMGEVYRARDTSLNREVALKVLPPLFALDPRRVARFRREAHVLAALNHPNIAAIYGFEESGPVQALVLELVEGPTLADRIARGRLPLDEVLAIARQIADALEAAHEKGIVHRDLKPANIKISPSGVVKVLDFGLAKVWEGAPEADGASSALTSIDLGERILGTPGYMSPEQARGRGLDKRTDLWSFGCVLFEMLSGRPAFAGDTIPDTIARVLDAEPDWQALPGSIPAGLRQLLRRCLQKDRSRRLRDIGDARLDLDELDAAIGGTAAAAGPQHATGRAVRAGVAALLVAAAAAVAYLAARMEGVPPPTFRQLTFRHGAITGARLAVDGQTVVYRATWTGAQPQLYVMRPDSRQPGAIGLLDAGIYSVSFRGDLAVALACRLNWGECLGTLAEVPITGGSPRELVKNVLGADWSPDGRTMAVVLVSGNRHRLEYPIGRVLYESPGWLTSARVSPRAESVAFLDHPRLGDSTGSVAVVDLNGRKTTLSAGWRSLYGLAWSPSGDEVWFTGSRTGKGGASALYAVTLSGQERAAFSSPGMLKLNDVSRDGRRMLITRGTTRGGIIVGSTDRTNERDLSWFDYSTVADLSADGRTLLFYEWGEGVDARPTVFIRRTDGSDAVRLGEGRPLALSPDSRWALALRENESRGLVLLPTGTGDVRALPRGPLVEYLDWAAWSPDGRRVYFAGRESPDVRRTYVQDVDGGDPRPVTPDGFVGILLSPDGRTIATVDRYGEYYLCSTEGPAEPRPLAGYVDGDVPLQWSGDGGSLFVREAGNLVLRIHTLDLSDGRRRFWKELAPPDPTVLTDIGSDPGQVRITPDGRFSAYTYWTFEGELYLAEGIR